MENLSLLTLILEKFGSFISYGEENNVALVDIAKTTAAVAASIVNTNDPKTAKLSIVSGDLLGIQNFIDTISSDGALKSLRARSFYLELVTEEVVAQLLTHLELPRTNVIYAGGGNIYILAPGNENTENLVSIFSVSNGIITKVEKCILPLVLELNLEQHKKSGSLFI